MLFINDFRKYVNIIPTIEKNMERDIYWSKEEIKEKKYENNRKKQNNKLRINNGKIVKKYVYKIKIF